MGIKQSKKLEKPNHDHEMSLNPIQTTAERSSPHRIRIRGGSSMSMSGSVALHKAALKGDWNSGKEVIGKNRGLVSTPITEGGETALHIAAIQGHQVFVSNLMKMMEVSELEIQNKKGCTALCFAAAAGHIHVARLMLDHSSHLATVKGDIVGVRPIFMAVLRGYHQMATFLLPLSDFHSWTTKDQADLLTACIDSRLYGLATSIVLQHNTLVVAEDNNGETPLQVLARNPSAFSCDSDDNRNWVKNIITLLVRIRPSKTHVQDESAEGDALTLLGCLWDAAAQVCAEEDIEAARSNTLKLFFIAAEHGNDDFLVELLKLDPDLLYKVNRSKQSIFHIAVLRRYVKVFNLLYELGGIKGLIATYIDTDGNNMLHLAARLAPPEQLNAIPGAALQMQREVIWYKEVEKLVQPSYRNQRNNAGQTPHQVFLAEHDALMKQGEKLMKQTAKACMLVTMLIATVVFTTAFTVPGGYDNTTGVPILQNNKMFVVFPVSEAVATLSSLTSMLMFMAILTSRYSGEDFLRTLPFWLVVGVAALFLSIVAMMVAFCTCLLFFEHGWATGALVLVFFASVPTMFVVLKYPLLVTILRCTYSCNWLFRSYDRLHS